MNAQEFVEYLCEEGMDTSSIISFVREQDELVKTLIKFLKKGVSKIIQNREWEPLAILFCAVDLKLLEHTGEGIYRYSDVVKVASGE